MSHITIIISSKGSQQLASGNGTDDVEVTYTPPDDMKPGDIGKEVAKRIRWIDSGQHMDAAED
jgi:hypothetical protein